MTDTRAESWFHITNSGAHAEISLFGDIGRGRGRTVGAQAFIRELNALGDSTALTVRINSPGGDVFEAIAIYNALRARRGKVTCIVDGLAASAASFIAMAGDEVVMRPNTEMMVHDALIDGMRGNAATLRDTADQLERASNTIAGVYAEKAGGTADTWRAVMRTDTWYSADEAVAAGLADRVDTARPRTARAPAIAAHTPVHRTTVLVAAARRRRAHRKSR